jgi:hypothetical protein
MSQEERRSSRELRAKRFLFMTLLAGLLTVGFIRLTPNAPGIHYLQYRAAADLLTSGRDPYDIAEQSRLQRAIYGEGLRWPIDYNYPPWFALACAPLTYLPYRVAEAFFLFLTSFSLFLAADLLHTSAPGLSRWATIIVVVGFLPSLFAAQTSQTAPLILLLTALLWRTLEQRRSRLAGFTLAWLSIKPQLSTAIVLGVLVWSARLRRWGLIGAFTVTLVVLCLASAIVDPLWPLQMHGKLGRGLPGFRPEIGVTWPMLLRTWGLTGWHLTAAYAGLAVPALAEVVRSAWDRGGRAGDVIGLGAIAAFVVAPYAQFYDFPMLLVPLFALLGDRPPSLSLFALLLAMLVLPYLNLYVMVVAGWPPCTFAWVPALLAMAWLVKARVTSTARPGGLGQQEESASVGGVW